MYLSIAVSLLMVTDQEQARGYRYTGVVLCRPDVLLRADIKLSEYHLKSYVYHNAGNHNTGDILFVLSSESAEAFTCILPLYLPSAEYYDGLTEHSAKFLPQVIPEITRKVLVDSDITHSNLHIFPNAIVPPRFVDIDHPLRKRSPDDQLHLYIVKAIWPYRKAFLNHPLCSFLSYDRAQRNRCLGWAPEAGFDHICISYQQQEAAAELVRRSQVREQGFYLIEAHPLALANSLARICIKLPEPRLDLRNTSSTDVAQVINSLFA